MRWLADGSIVKTDRHLRFLSLLILLGVVANGFAQGSKESPERFRQLTRSIDPFDRLAGYPEGQRSTEAVDLCIGRIGQLSSTELLRLKGDSDGEISEKQGRHLFATVSMIVETLVTVDTIESEFQPALDPGTVQRLERLRLSIEPWLEINGVPLENLELNVPDCLSLLKGLARVCKE